MTSLGSRRDSSADQSPLLIPTAGGWQWIIAATAACLIVGGLWLGFTQADRSEYLISGVVLGYVTHVLYRWKHRHGRGRNDATNGSVEAAAGFRPLEMTPFAWRTRLAYWLSGAAMSTGIGGGLLAATATVAPSLFSIPNGRDIAPEHLGFFGATTLVAVWFLTFGVKLTQGFLRHTPAERREGVRRLTLVLAGLATGAATWGIGRYLELDLNQVFAGQEIDGLFDTLGERQLAMIENGRLSAPTLLGFMVFFGSLFGLRSWWRQIDLFRESRFRAASVLMSVLVAWLCTALFAFPQTWALLWAAMISATVQLASPYSERLVRSNKRSGR